MHRATFAMIDLDAFAHNVHVIRQRLSPQTKLLVAVKANAYGHGIGPVMSRIRQLPVDQVAVASVEEGLQIRRIDITTPVLVLGALGPLDLVAAAEHELQVLYTDTWGPIDDIPPLPCPLNVHIALDTGMNRLGIKSLTDVRSIINTIHRRSDMFWGGLGTHFASSDEPDATQSEDQIAELERALQVIRTWGYSIPLVHAANSGAVLRNPAWHFDMVRVGIAAYGYSPNDEVVPAPELKPVMHVYASVTRVQTIQPGEAVGYGATFRAKRPMRLATISIGYADGLPRILSNCGILRVRGRDVGVIGRVSMDQAMIDVSEVDDVQVGDFVTLFGSDAPPAWTSDAWQKTMPEDRAAWLKATFMTSSDESAYAPLGRLARIAQTIPYEFVCQINQRVPKLYVSM